MPADVKTEDLKARYENLGLISVKVWRMNLLGKKEAHEATLAPTASETGVVPEKALKGQALSLATRYVECLLHLHQHIKLTLTQFRARGKEWWDDCLVRGEERARATRSLPLQVSIKT